MKNKKELTYILKIKRIYDFLARNRGLAYTVREIRKNVDTRQLKNYKLDDEYREYLELLRYMGVVDYIKKYSQKKYYLVERKKQFITTETANQFNDEEVKKNAKKECQ